MRVWLVTSGEPLPIDAGRPRLLRAGMIARSLQEAGHDVVWWTAAFDHRTKRQRLAGCQGRACCDGLELRLLDSPGYRRNVSLERLWDHVRLGFAFQRRAPEERSPEVIVASLPPLELCAAAVAYGQSRAIPTVVDIRDLWPQVFEQALPRACRPAAGLLLAPYWQLARYCCRRAQALTGPSAGYVSWGLKLARRGVSDFDRVFPFAYPLAPPEAKHIAEAERMWEERGIRASGDELRVCFFGTFGSQFDFETPIAAARCLREQGRRIRFILCGAGDREARWRRLARGCENVLLPGWVDAAAIWVLMRRCHLGIAPYRECPNFALNIPNKPIEYLSAGLPVVTALRGELGSMLERQACGVFYENNDGSSLAAALAELAGAPRRLEMLAQNARQAFSREFTAETVYPAMAEYLERLAARRCLPPKGSPLRTQIAGGRL